MATDWWDLVNRGKGPSFATKAFKQVEWPQQAFQWYVRTFSFIFRMNLTRDLVNRGEGSSLATEAFKQVEWP